MHLITRRTTGVLLAAALLATACGGSDDDAEAGIDHSGGSPRLVEANRTRTSPPADAPVEAVVAGLQDFSVKLAATEPDGNLVLSPTSIAIAFAMAEAGADEATAAEIAEVFGFPEQPGVHEAFNALTAEFESVNGGSGDDEVTLALANQIWGQSGVTFGEPFLDVLASNYGAGVETTDFADVEASRDTINRWVADVTRDRIPELVPAGMISPQTVVMLVNAIYLKARWAAPFSADLTVDRDFHLADGSTIQVPTMVKSNFATTAHQGDGYTAVELPYVGDDLSMVVVLPDEGTSLATFESQLTGAGLGAVVAGLSDARVDLEMPRWEAQSALDLAGPLSDLGLTIPGGNLSGITPGASLDAAVHAANITVDEEGTEAAAATAVGGVTALPPGDVLTVTIDRPFLFLIQHQATGTPLFYGRITVPSSK